MIGLLKRLHEDESGHMTPFLTTGIVGNWDVVTIIGGVFRHIEVDYDVMERLSDLEG